MITNKQIKLIHSLQQKKYRKKENLFVVEGEKMVEEAVKSDFTVVEIYVTESNLLTRFTNAELIERTQMKKISTLTNPSNCLAVVELKNNLTDELSPNGWYLGLEAVRDPGNMGTIIRTADWFGIDTIFCSSDCVDVYNDKTVQASMGSIFRMNIVVGDLQEIISNSKALNLPVFATLLEGDNIYDLPSFNGGLILMGNEGKGLTHNLVEASNSHIHIPGKGKAESLNVAMATGIAMAILMK